jgi:hypothetical protein
MRSEPQKRCGLSQIFDTKEAGDALPRAREGDRAIRAVIARRAPYVGGGGHLHDRDGQLPDRPDADAHMTTDRLSEIAGREKYALGQVPIIQDLLRLDPMHPDYCRRELLANNPMAWMIRVNGFIVDARTLPSEMQEEAQRRGLIPDLTQPP